MVCTKRYTLIMTNYVFKYHCLVLCVCVCVCVFFHQYFTSLLKLLEFPINAFPEFCQYWAQTVECYIRQFIKTMRKNVFKSVVAKFGSLRSLTLSQTSPGFYVSAVQVFRKHHGKRRNCA